MSYINDDVFLIITGILSGVLVFVMGRWIEKIYIDPIKEQRVVIAEIYDTLIFHSDKINNPLDLDTNDEKRKNRYSKASEELRRLSTKLRATTFNIKFYGIYSFLTRSPNKRDISEVCIGLIGLSNSLFIGVGNGEILDEKSDFIMKKLKLYKFETFINQRL